MPYFTTGKVAVITGGSTGCGKAIAEQLVEYGCKVVIGDTLDDEGQKTVDELNNLSSRSATYLHTNTTVYKDVNALFKLAESEFGQVDIVVLDSGVIRTEDLQHASTDVELHTLVPIHHFTGLMKCTRVAALNMHKHGGGVIVSTLTVAGPRVAEPNDVTSTTESSSATEKALERVEIALAKYSANKHSIDGWMEALGLLNLTCSAAAGAVSPDLLNEKTWAITPTLAEALLQVKELTPKIDATMLEGYGKDAIPFPKLIVDSILKLMVYPDINIQVLLTFTPNVKFGTKRDPPPGYGEAEERWNEVLQRCKDKVRKYYAKCLKKLPYESVEKEELKKVDAHLSRMVRESHVEVKRYESDEPYYEEKVYEFLSSQMKKYYEAHMISLLKYYGVSNVDSHI
ncbi:hypothetical protein BJV82DRAFT_610953 [Fennellomyces sp. T-0311]|nr:hypothetical protein BJV82DRAFT_610953 [Fennellomyces sp. T-0311]